MNEVVVEKNCLDSVGGKKRHVRFFINNELWKFIGPILSEVTYGKKGHKPWVKTQTSVGKKV